MSSDFGMEKKLPMGSTHPIDVDSDVGTTSHVIYIDPEKEKAAFRKFDRYVLPVSVIFMVLSALDRNNVSLAFAP